MKKHLLSTSAIALGVAMAAPAAAQEWDVSFGGFMSQHIGYADIGGTVAAGRDLDGVDIHSSTEIIFTPSITLDNGLTFGVNVQLEGENAGNSQIDESYMTISSDTLGRIVVGSENSAGYSLMTSAPVVTSMAINSPSISTFIPFSGVETSGGDGIFGFRQAGLSSFTEVGGNNDVQRLTYYTPSFNGLTLGVSYAPTGDVNVGNSFNVDKNQVLSDIFDIGVNYSQTFGTTTVTLAARYGTGSAPSYSTVTNTGPGPDGLNGTADDLSVTTTTLNTDSDPETWGVGAQIGFGAFAIGASYAENDNGALDGAGDSEGWNLGMTYDIAGPWAVEAVTYQGEVDTGAFKADYEAYRIGASRDLGPGVDWDIYVAYVNADNGEVGVDRSTVDGTVIGTGINLSF
ncbi:MAG TPA: porin [Roseovarius sp.]